MGHSGGSRTAWGRLKWGVLDKSGHRGSSQGCFAFVAFPDMDTDSLHVGQHKRLPGNMRPLLSLEDNL